MDLGALQGNRLEPLKGDRAGQHGQRGVTADTALRLARYFGTTPQVWMNLQKTWELRRAELEVGRDIESHVEPRKATA